MEIGDISPTHLKSKSDFLYLIFTEWGGGEDFYILEFDFSPSYLAKNGDVPLNQRWGKKDSYTCDRGGRAYFYPLKLP